MSGSGILDDRERYRKAFLLLLVVFISAMFVSMLRSFLMTILLAAIFSGLMAPFYSAVCRLLRGRRFAASAVTVVALVLVIFVPLLLVLGIVAGQAIRISETAGPWIQTQIHNPDELIRRLENLPFVARIEPFRGEILTRAGEAVGSIGNYLVGSLSAMTKGTVNFLFHFSILLYTMFYFLVDGERTLARILYYVPLDSKDEARMVGRFVSVAKATLKGTLLIGIIQGSLAGAALAAAGIGSALFWATLMTVLSIIPGVGTALVWLPAGGYLIASGHVTSGILLIVFCGAVVGSVDNLLRPRIVGRDTQLHVLVVLFATLGGLMLFGLVGFVVGPILAALFVTVWELYGVAFGNVLPPKDPHTENG